MSIFDKKDTDEDLIKKAKIYFAKKEDTGGNGEAIHIKRGEEFKYQRGPCHGFIRESGNKNSVAILSRVVRKAFGYKENQDEVKDCLPAYYDWLFNRSPWRHVYESKDAEKVLKDGYCMLRVDQPGNITQGALIATRHTWEYSRNVSLWHTLVTKYGVNEHIAFVAMFMFNTDSQGKVFLSTSKSDHTPINTREMFAEGLQAFFSNTPLVETQPFNETGTHRGVQAAFAGEGEKLLIDMVKEEFEMFSSKRSTICFNPFLKAKANANKGNSRGKVMDMEEFVSFVSSVFPTYLK